MLSSPVSRVVAVLSDVKEQENLPLVQSAMEQALTHN